MIKPINALDGGGKKGLWMRILVINHKKIKVKLARSVRTDLLLSIGFSS
jgi:hypothetical protein